MNYIKNGDRPSFMPLKSNLRLMVVDGYIFEYDDKNMLIFDGIPLSEKENIQIRDWFFMDSQTISPYQEKFANFVSVKGADPKTFRPLTNIDITWADWNYMIDKNYCYWFGWDRVNNSGIIYNTIPECNPMKLLYLWWTEATDGIRFFSGGTINSSWSNLHNIIGKNIPQTIMITSHSGIDNTVPKWKEVNNPNFWSKIPGYSPLWITFSYPENWKFNCCGDRDDGSVHQIIASGSYIGNPPHILIMKYIINCRREDIGYSDTWLCKKPLTDSESFDYLTTLSWWVLRADAGTWFVEVSRDWIMTRDSFTSDKDRGFVFRKNWGIYIVQFHNSPFFEQKFIEDFLSRIKDDVTQ